MSYWSRSIYQIASKCCLFGLLPVVALQAVLFPLWMLRETLPPTRPFIMNWLLADLPDLEMLITGIAVPVFLCAVGMRLTRTTTPMQTVFTVCFLVFCSWISSFLSYANWGIATGSFWRPDGETVQLEVGVAGLSLILMAAISFTVFAIRRFSTLRS